MADAERYLVRCRKLPYEERDVAHASPFMDTYEDVHPGQVGMQVTYSVDLGAVFLLMPRSRSPGLPSRPALSLSGLWGRMTQ